MKRVNYITGLVVAVLLMSSCSDWLNVVPRGQHNETTAFESEGAYQSTLIGVYQLMATTELYGRNATMRVPEFITHHWDISNLLPTDGNRLLSEFDFVENAATSAINEMWDRAYRAIAQINLIIAHLEEPGNVTFSGNNRELMLGEAHGLRAFLHLDLLRFFGPVPAELLLNPDAKVLPYMKKFDRVIAAVQPVTWEVYIDEMMADLDYAMEVLKEIDPIMSYSQNEWYRGRNLAPSEFEYNRPRRFNYYAAAGTKVRALMWTRDMTDQSNIDEVVSLAKDIVDGEDPQYDDIKRFELAGAGDLYVDTGDGSRSLGNYTMNREHIFALNNKDLQSIVEPMFVTNVYRDNSDGLHFPPYIIGTVSAKSLISATDDWRGLGKHRMWNVEVSDQNGSEAPYSLFKKYTDNMAYVNNTGGEMELKSSNRIPLLRAGEFYLILMEYLPVFEARQYAAAFAASRGLGATWADNFDDTNRMNILEREYRRDFYGEGQMYFYYKRHNYADRSVSWPQSFTFTPAAFRFPLPKNYTDYVYAEDLPEEPETPNGSEE